MQTACCDKISYGKKPTVPDIHHELCTVYGQNIMSEGGVAVSYTHLDVYKRQEQ